MKIPLVSVVGAVTIVMVGAVGCSKNDSSTDAKTTSATTTSAAATSSAPAGGTGAAKVTIDGQLRPIGGPVVCATADGKFSIAIGEVITGVIVGLEPDASVVHTVGLGDLNGVVLSFTEGVPGNAATATKDGNTYTVTGTATGVDSAGKQVSKPFEVVATCP
jgi:lipoprotein LpqH